MGVRSLDGFDACNWRRRVVSPANAAAKKLGLSFFFGFDYTPQ